MYVQKNTNTCKMKENNGKLTISYENIKSINQAKSILLKLCNPINISKRRNSKNEI